MGAIDSIGGDLQCANDASKVCQYKNKGFSVTSIIYVLVACFALGGIYFTFKNELGYMKKDICTNEVRIESLQVQMTQTRESFTRLDERLAGLQRELSEIKGLLKSALDTRGDSRVDYRTARKD
jgi:hypothetical protein